MVFPKWSTLGSVVLIVAVLVAVRLAYLKGLSRGHVDAQDMPISQHLGPCPDCGARLTLRHESSPTQGMQWIQSEGPSKRWQSIDPDELPLELQEEMAAEMAKALDGASRVLSGTVPK